MQTEEAAIYSIGRMSIEQSSPATRTLSELTREYHQNILRLTHEFSGSEIAWNVSQHVLDQLWENQASFSAPSEKRSSSSAVIAYACQACGYQLYPGWEGTTLRVKQPNKALSPSAKKTLRRRELRKRKKAAQTEAMKGRGRNSNSRSKGIDQANTASEVTICLLRDDPGIRPLDRNRLVLTCGRCGNKTLCKGLRRATDVKTAPLELQHKPVAASRPSKGSLTGEFERLPSLSRKPPPQSSFGESVTQKPSFKTTTPLEQKLGKKKKKKPKKTLNTKKGGNLMNFLSSLNDH